MRVSGSILQIAKVAVAASLCLGSTAAVASGAVRPSVKLVAAPPVNASLVVSAVPNSVRAGAPVEEESNNILGLALLPLLGLTVAAVVAAAVVASADDDEEISPGS